MTTGVIPLPIRNQIFAFTSGHPFRDFLNTPQARATLMAHRFREVRIRPDDQAFFVSYPDTLYLIALVSADDPDTTAVLPILAQIAESSPRLDLSVVRDDEDLTLIDQLVNEIDVVASLDELDLPLLLVFDEEWQFQESWGPRPQAAESYVDEWLSNHPEYEELANSDDEKTQDKYLELLDQLTYEMRIWYNSGLNNACVTEIHNLLAGLQSEDNGAPDEIAGEG